MAAKTTGRKSAVKLDTKALLAVVVCAALSAATYFFFTAPMRSSAADLQSQVTLKEGELTRNNQRINDIENKRTAAADQVLVEARKLDRLLPPDVDKVALVATIPTLASKYNVVVNQMDPSSVAEPASASSSSGLRTQAFTVAATGSVDSVAGWIDALQAFPSTVAISGLSLNIDSSGQAVASFTLKAYYVPTAALKVRN